MKLGRHYFNNGYGASVVCHDFSYGGDNGLAELAVLKEDTDGDWHLCYDTPITDDVIGHLSSKEVDKLLKKIEALPPAKRRKK